MAVIGEAFIAVRPDTDERGFSRQVEKDVTNPLKTAVKGIGKAVAAAAAVAAAGVALAVGAGIKGAVEIERGLAEVVTLTGETGAAAAATLAELSDGVRALSDEIGIAQTELVPALYDAISAGVPKDNVFEFMEVAGQAAIAGVTEVGTAVDGLTTTLNAFGLDASRVQDVADSMFTAVRGGKTNFQELSDALFNVAPAAAAAGVGFEEVNAAIATLTAGGTPTSVATTQIRAALVGLARPSKELDAIFQNLGFANAELAVRAEGLGFALDAVREASGGSTGALQQLLGSTEAVAAANVLAGTGSEKFRDELDAQAESAGATTAAFEVMNETVGRQFDELKTRLSNVAIGIGQAILPTLNRALDGILAGVGEATFAWGLFTDQISGNRATTRVARATGQMTGLGEVAVVLAGIYEDVRDRITVALDALRVWWDTNGPQIVERVREVAQSVVTWWDETARPAVVTFGEELWRFYNDTVVPVLDQLKQVWEENSDEIGDIFVHLGEILRDLAIIVGEVFSDMEGDVQESTPSIAGNLNIILTALEGIVSAIATLVRWGSIVSDVWWDISPIGIQVQMFQRFRDTIQTVVAGLERVLDLMGALPDNVKAGLVPKGISLSGSLVPKGLPELAHGAIVFDPMVAVVGDNAGKGEAVVPLEKLPAIMRKAMSGAGGQLVGTMNVYGTEPVRTARQTVRALRDRVYLGGGFAPQIGVAHG